MRLSFLFILLIGLLCLHFGFAEPPCQKVDWEAIRAECKYQDSIVVDYDKAVLSGAKLYT